MNVLFLSLLDFNSFSERNIYSDLLREFIKHGHRVCCISPVEIRNGKDTTVIHEGESQILKLKIGNTQKVNIIEKGISTILIESQYINGIKKYFADIKFDLVLYATPPITFGKVIQFVKRRDGAKSYLMLKDIFPQNAVDLGMMTKNGLKGVIYKYFRNKEKKLYTLSDTIGCMSEANRRYVIAHNPEIAPDKVEICPNSIEPQDLSVTDEQKIELRKKYGFPRDKKIFVYGGNLGRPQDVPFIIKCLEHCESVKDAFFVIAGSGTDRHLLEEYMREKQPNHVKLLGQVPKDEYDSMIACCDVGLIFLDHRFTIPNFPSRLLSYMQAGLPVLACTDRNTDVGKVIAEGGFGWWCESVHAEPVKDIVMSICEDLEPSKRMAAIEYLKLNYNAEKSYAIINQLF